MRKRVGHRKKGRRRESSHDTTSSTPATAMPKRAEVLSTSIIVAKIRKMKPAAA